MIKGRLSKRNSGPRIKLMTENSTATHSSQAKPPLT